MPSRDTNGLPVVNAISGIFSGDAVAASIKQLPAESQVSVASIVRSLLDTADENITIAYDVNHRRFAACPSSKALKTQLNNLSGVGKIVYTPTAGQEGRTLEWEFNDSNAVDAPSLASLEELVAPVNPRYTAESFMQKIAQTVVCPATKPNAIIVLDQSLGKVTAYFHASATDMSDEVDGIVDRNTPDPDTVAISIGEPAVAGSSSLKLEGGAV